MLYPVPTDPAFTAHLFAYLHFHAYSLEAEISDMHLPALLLTGLIYTARKKIVTAFTQGGKCEKEKEPRSPAHRKIREGKENRFQLLAPATFL